MECLNRFIADDPVEKTRRPLVITINLGGQCKIQSAFIVTLRESGHSLQALFRTPKWQTVAGEK